MPIDKTDDPVLLAITSASPKDIKATYQAGAWQVGAGQVK